jgi:hypothetical protein
MPTTHFDNQMGGIEQSGPIALVCKPNTMFGTPPKGAVQTEHNVRCPLPNALPKWLQHVDPTKAFKNGDGTT